MVADFASTPREAMRRFLTAQQEYLLGDTAAFTSVAQVASFPPELAEESLDTKMALSLLLRIVRRFHIWVRS